MANERAEQFRGKAKALIKREVDQYKQDFVTTLTTADPTQLAQLDQLEEKLQQSIFDGLTALSKQEADEPASLQALCFEMMAEAQEKIAEATQAMDDYYANLPPGRQLLASRLSDHLGLNVYQEVPMEDGQTQSKIVGRVWNALIKMTERNNGFAPAEKETDAEWKKRRQEQAALINTGGPFGYTLSVQESDRTLNQAIQAENYVQIAVANQNPKKISDYQVATFVDKRTVNLEETYDCKQEGRQLFNPDKTPLFYRPGFLEWASKNSANGKRPYYLQGNESQLDKITVSWITPNDGSPAFLHVNVHFPWPNWNGQPRPNPAEASQYDREVAQILNAVRGYAAFLKVTYRIEGDFNRSSNYKTPLQQSYLNLNSPSENRVAGSGPTSLVYKSHRHLQQMRENDLVIAKPGSTFFLEPSRELNQSYTHFQMQAKRKLVHAHWQSLHTANAPLQNAAADQFEGVKAAEIQRYEDALQTAFDSLNQTEKQSVEAYRESLLAHGKELLGTLQPGQPLPFQTLAEDKQPSAGDEKEEKDVPAALVSDVDSPPAGTQPPAGPSTPPKENLPPMPSAVEVAVEIKNDGEEKAALVSDVGSPPADAQSPAGAPAPHVDSPLAGAQPPAGPPTPPKEDLPPMPSAVGVAVEIKDDGEEKSAERAGPKKPLHPQFNPVLPALVNNDPLSQQLQGKGGELKKIKEEAAAAQQPVDPKKQEALLTETAALSSEINLQQQLKRLSVEVEVFKQFLNAPKTNITKEELNKEKARLKGESDNQQTRLKERQNEVSEKKKALGLTRVKNAQRALSQAGREEHARLKRDPELVRLQQTLALCKATCECVQAKIKLLADVTPRAPYAKAPLMMVFYPAGGDNPSPQQADFNAQMFSITQAGEAAIQEAPLTVQFHNESLGRFPNTLEARNICGFLDDEDENVNHRINPRHYREGSSMAALMTELARPGDEKGQPHIQMGSARVSVEAMKAAQRGIQVWYDGNFLTHIEVRDLLSLKQTGEIHPDSPVKPLLKRYPKERERYLDSLQSKATFCFVQGDVTQYLQHRAGDDRVLAEPRGLTACHAVLPRLQHGSPELKDFGKQDGALDGNGRATWRFTPAGEQLYKEKIKAGLRSIFKTAARNGKAINLPVVNAFVRAMDYSKGNDHQFKAKQLYIAAVLELLCDRNAIPPNFPGLFLNEPRKQIQDEIQKQLDGLKQKGRQLAAPLILHSLDADAPQYLATQAAKQQNAVLMQVMSTSMADPISPTGNGMFWRFEATEAREENSARCLNGGMQVVFGFNPKLYEVDTYGCWADDPYSPQIDAQLQTYNCERDPRINRIVREAELQQRERWAQKRVQQMQPYMQQQPQQQLGGDGKEVAPPPPPQPQKPYPAGGHYQQGGPGLLAQTPAGRGPVNDPAGPPAQPEQFGAHDADSGQSAGPGGNSGGR